MRSAGASRHWWIWVLVVPAAAWTLIRVFGLDRGFPLVAMIAFTPYVAVAALLVAGVAVAVRNWVAAVVTGLATLALAVAVLPRAVGDGTVEASGRETLSVLSVNAFVGRADPDALVRLVERLEPDVLAIQELTPKSDRALRVAGLDRQLPNSLVEVRTGAAGSGIFSRLPLRPLPSPDGFFFRMPRAELTFGGDRRVRLVDVHPFPPNRNQVREWEEALRSLPTAGRGAPWVLAGDFNATLDNSALRDVLDRGYRDAAAVAGEGLVPTWPANRRFGPLVTIDHVLGDRRLDVVSYEVERLPGTDHRPVFAVLALP